MVQLFLDCIDRATASSKALFHSKNSPCFPKTIKTLHLRVVDAIAEEGVWAMKDDGCNCCSHGEDWRRNAEAKMNILGLHTFWIYRKATTFNGFGTSTTSGKLKIPMAVRL